MEYRGHKINDESYKKVVAHNRTIHLENGNKVDRASLARCESELDSLGMVLDTMCEVQQRKYRNTHLELFARKGGWVLIPCYELGESPDEREARILYEKKEIDALVDYKERMVDAKDRVSEKKHLNAIERAKRLLAENGYEIKPKEGSDADKVVVCGDLYTGSGSDIYSTPYRAEFGISKLEGMLGMEFEKDLRLYYRTMSERTRNKCERHLDKVCRAYEKYYNDDVSVVKINMPKLKNC